MNTTMQYSETKRTDIPAGASHFSAGSATLSSEDGKFKLVPYSGQHFAHWYWGKLAFDVSGIEMRKSVIPAFVDHDHSRIAGEIDGMEKKGAIIELSGDFLDNEEAEKLQKTKKLEWECSLAFDLSSAIIEEVFENATAEVNGEKFEGPGYIVRKAELYETSFTFWGAVPGTATQFDNNGKTVSTTILEVKRMADESVSVEQVRADGKAQATALFAKMNELCDDAKFVAECFSKDMGIEEFQSELLGKFKAEVAQLKEEIETLKKAKADAPAVEFHNGEDEPEEELSFVEKAQAFARENGVSLRSAFSQIAKSDRDLYEEFVDSCPVAVQAKRRK